MSLTKVSYSMIQGEMANILDYGADDTGVASSSAALDAAIATGKTVYVPKGTYKLTTMSTLTSGACIVGEGPLKSQFVCDSLTYSDVFLRIAGGNNIVEKVSFVGNSTANGTAIRIANTDEYAFTGYVTIRNVNVTGIKTGIDMNNVFSVLVDSCRVYGNNRGIRIVPSYSVSSDSGYFTTVTINKCFINQNTDYGLAASPTLRSHNLVLRDTVIEANTGSTGGNQTRILRVDPLLIENCYFELESTIPALSLDDCVTTINGIYMNDTGGIDLGAVSNTLYLNNSSIGASTDALYANGTVLQQIQIVNSSLGTSTLNAQRLSIQNSTISSVYYRNYNANYDLTLASDISNTTRLTETLAYKKTVTATIGANSSARLITDQPISNIFSSDWTVAMAQIVNIDILGITLTVGPAASTGSKNYFCVIATNTTGSPITLTNAELKVMFIKGDGAVAL